MQKIPIFSNIIRFLYLLSILVLILFLSSPSSSDYSSSDSFNKNLAVNAIELGFSDDFNDGILNSTWVYSDSGHSTTFVERDNKLVGNRTLPNSGDFWEEANLTKAIDPLSIAKISVDFEWAFSIRGTVYLEGVTSEGNRTFKVQIRDSWVSNFPRFEIDFYDESQNVINYYYSSNNLNTVGSGNWDISFADNSSTVNVTLSGDYSYFLSATNVSQTSALRIIFRSHATSFQIPTTGIFDNYKEYNYVLNQIPLSTSASDSNSSVITTSGEDIFSSSNSNLIDNSDIAITTVAGLFLLSSGSGLIFYARRKKKALAGGLSRSHMDITDLTDTILLGEDTLEVRNIDYKLPFILLLISPIIAFFSLIVRSTKYRNMSRFDILKNPLRNDILTILEVNEFDHFNSIRDQLNCGVYILKWHLEVLEEFGIITTSKINQYQIIHLGHTSPKKEKVLLYYSVRTTKILSFLKLLIEKQDLQIFQIAINLDLQIKYLENYCKKLLNLKIISYNKIDGTIIAFPQKHATIQWVIERFQKKQISS